MKTLKNILFIDDESFFFGRVFKYLELKLNEKNTINLLPNNNEDYQNIISNMEGENYNLILSYIKDLGIDIDLFIVDIFYTEKHKKNGFQFLKHLEDVDYNKGKYDFILLTNAETLDGYNLSKYTIEKVPCVWKSNLGSYATTLGIVEEIKKIYI